MGRQSEEVIRNTVNAIAPLDGDAMAQARARQDQLTKPRGSLGLAGARHSGRLDRDPGHHHILRGLLIDVDGDGGDCPDNVQSLDDLSKDGIVAVQIVLSAVADIELG